MSGQVALAQVPAACAVADYVPFVRRVAVRLARRLPSHIRLDDLIGAGMIGLLEAFKRYDEARKTQFERYAEFRIKGAILDELRRRDLMARDARIEAKRIERVIHRLTNEIGRHPDEEEIAASLGLSLGQLRVKLERLTPVRVFNIEDDGYGLPASCDSPFENVARHELRDKLESALARLPERQQTVLQLYYVEELTLREIGEVLGVTESRVCQIVSESTMRLRTLMGISKEAGTGRQR